jgi:hypothetical protein
MWWMDLLLSIVSGVVSGCVSGAFIAWSLMILEKRREKKKEEARFLIDIEALNHELEGNSKGRGLDIPFQDFWLHNILRCQIFRSRYPEVLKKAVHTSILLGGKSGMKPSEIQAAVLALKEDINTVILKKPSS